MRRFRSMRRTGGERFDAGARARLSRTVVVISVVCLAAVVPGFAVCATAAVEGKGTFRIHAPLIAMTKAQIIATGHELGVDYALTHSCYDPAADGGACGHCDSCLLRRQGFESAGVEDPTRYCG